MKSIGMALRQLARKKCQVFVPLLLREGDGFTGTGSFGFAGAPEFDGTTVVTGSELAAERFGIVSRINSDGVRSGCQCKMQLALFETAVFQRIGSNGGDQLAGILTRVAAQIERDFELACLLTGCGAFKVAGGVVRGAGELSTDRNDPTHDRENDQHTTKSLHTLSLYRVTKRQ